MPVLDFEPQTESSSAGSLRERYCREHNRLLNQFAESVDELLLLHQNRFSSVVNGNPNSRIIDSLIEEARRKKDLAKEKYLEHTRQHGCASA